MNVIVFGIIWQVANKTILFSTFLLPPPSPLWRNALPCLSNSSLLIQLTLDISWHGTSKGQKYVCVMWFLFCIPAFCHDKQNKTRKHGFDNHQLQGGRETYRVDLCLPNNLKPTFIHASLDQPAAAWPYRHVKIPTLILLYVLDLGAGWLGSIFVDIVNWEENW